jgi:hypothetical protein
MPTDTPTWTQHWPEFERRMKARLDAGHHEYGDRSFAQPTTTLARELEEEALDIVGWGFILWVRIRQLETLMQSGIELEKP